MPSGYCLVFEDNFDGTELDRSRWNVELHPPGWVNEELQEYVEAPETICIGDRKLHIRPAKTVHEDGRPFHEAREWFSAGAFSRSQGWLILAEALLGRHCRGVKE